MESAARGGGRAGRGRARDRVGGAPAPARSEGPVPPGPKLAAHAATAAASGSSRVGHRLPFPSGGGGGRSLCARAPLPRRPSLRPRCPRHDSPNAGPRVPRGAVGCTTAPSPGSLAPGRVGQGRTAGTSDDTTFPSPGGPCAPPGICPGLATADGLSAPPSPPHNSTPKTQLPQEARARTRGPGGLASRPHLPKPCSGLSLLEQPAPTASELQRPATGYQLAGARPCRTARSAPPPHAAARGPDSAPRSTTAPPGCFPHCCGPGGRHWVAGPWAQSAAGSAPRSACLSAQVDWTPEGREKGVCRLHGAGVARSLGSFRPGVVDALGRAGLRRKHPVREASEWALLAAGAPGWLRTLGWGGRTRPGKARRVPLLAGRGPSSCPKSRRWERAARAVGAPAVHGRLTSEVHLQVRAHA